MKKLAVILLAAVTAVIVLSGFAVLSPSSGIYVYDDGDYLTAEQEQQIQNHILEVRDKVKSDFFVVFTENPASDDYRREAEKACDRFISAGGGYGDDHQTICFYVDMENRYFFIGEHNDSEKFKLKDSEVDSIVLGTVRDYMSQGNYYGASMQFVDDASNAAKPGFFGTIWGWLTSGLAGGGAISGILVGKHKRQPATPKTHYRKENGTLPLRAQDHFLGTTREVRHIERQQQEKEGGSGGTISSSSGSSGNHGGGTSF